jgi:hypothetical protein
MAHAENVVLDSWQELGELEEVIEPELEIVDPVSVHVAAAHARPTARGLRLTAAPSDVKLWQPWQEPSSVPTA